MESWDDKNWKKRIYAHEIIFYEFLSIGAILSAFFHCVKSMDSDQLVPPDLPRYIVFKRGYRKFWRKKDMHIVGLLG